MADRRLATLKRPWPTAACLFLVVALVYLGTLTSAFAFDGVAYSGFVVAALQGNIALLFQPNHLLHGPLAYLLVLATGGAESGVPVHVRLQMMEALLGAAAVALLHTILRRLVGWGPAVAAPLAMAFTHAFWHFSTDVEIYSLAALLLVVSLGAALSACGSLTAGCIALAGAAAGLAALGQLAHAVFAAATAVVLAALTPARKVRTLLVFTAGFSVVLMAPLVPLVIGPFAVAPPDRRLDFLLGYARPSAVGSHLGATWSRFLSNVDAAFHALFASPTAGLRLATVVAALACLTLVTLRLRRYDATRRSAIAIAAGWCLAHGAFFMMWDSNPKYWMAAMIPWAILLALALEDLGRVLRPAVRIGVLAAVPASIIGCNFTAILADMDPGRNVPLSIATAIQEGTPPDAVILLSGLPPHVPLKIYVPYFSARRALTLDRYLRGADPMERLLALEHDLTEGVVPFFALSELVGSDEVQRELERRHGLPAGRLAQALNAATLVPAAERAGPLTLYRLAPRLPG